MDLSALEKMTPSDRSAVLEEVRANAQKQFTQSLVMTLMEECTTKVSGLRCMWTTCLHIKILFF